MENRETKIIETPINKNKIEIKTWLTARERRAISRVFLDGMEFSGGIESTKPIFKGELIDKAQDVALENVIVSIDKDKTNILNKILEMKSQDYDFIIAEVNKVTNPQTDLKK